MVDKETEAIFDALDIIRANEDSSVSNLVKRGVMTPQQGKRIDYLMKHPGRKREILEQWKKERKIWMHTGLKPILARWQKSEAAGVCEWCGSETPQECIKDHIMSDVNEVINSVMPKKPRGRKTPTADDQLAQPYFDDAIDMGGGE